MTQEEYFFVFRTLHKGQKAPFWSVAFLIEIYELRDRGNVFAVTNLGSLLLVEIIGAEVSGM